MVKGIRRATAICALAVLMTASVGCGKNRRVQPDEYEVLSAFINEQWAPTKDTGQTQSADEKTTRIVIFSMSHSDTDAPYQLYDDKGQPIPWEQSGTALQARLPALQPETFDNFRERNRHQSRFQPSFHMAPPYDLIEQSQFNSLFKNGGWTAFYKRFPGSPGAVTFSRVGFNADGTQALFFATNHCGGLCGGGAYVVMQKHDGHWTIEKAIETWMS
jgi:hypothetical protein